MPERRPCETVARGHVDRLIDGAKAEDAAVGAHASGKAAERVAHRWGNARSE